MDVLRQMQHTRQRNIYFDLVNAKACRIDMVSEIIKYAEENEDFKQALNECIAEENHNKQLTEIKTENATL